MFCIRILKKSVINTYKQNIKYKSRHYINEHSIYITTITTTTTTI